MSPSPLCHDSDDFAGKSLGRIRSKSHLASIAQNSAAQNGRLALQDDQLVGRDIRDATGSPGGVTDATGFATSTDSDLPVCIRTLNHEA